MTDRDRGFTLIEILIAIVLVGILSAVVVIGIGSLTKKGDAAGCAASADAARSATVVHFTDSGSYPATISDMTQASELDLPAGASVGADGLTVSAADWVMTMALGAGDGTAPTFSCATTTGATATGSSATVPATTVPATTEPATTTAPATTEPTTAAPATTLDPNQKAARVCVVDESATNLANVSIAYYTDGWHHLTTSTASGCLDTGVPLDTAYVSATYRGVTKQLRWSEGTPADGTTRFDFLAEPRFVRIVDASGDPVSGVVTRYYADGWQTFGPTGGDGCASTELLGGFTFLSAVDRGVDVQRAVELTKTPSDSCATTVVFARAARFVRVLDGSGAGVAGIAAWYATISWLPFQSTGSDGCASIELLPGYVSFAVSLDRGWDQQTINLAKVPSTSCVDAVTFAA